MSDNEFIPDEEISPDPRDELKEFEKNLTPEELTVAKIWYFRGAIAQQKIIYNLFGDLKPKKNKGGE